MDIKRKESDWTAMFSEVRSSNVSGSPSNIDATSRQISEQFTSDYVVPILASRPLKKRVKCRKAWFGVLFALVTNDNIEGIIHFHLTIITQFRSRLS